MRTTLILFILLLDPTFPCNHGGKVRYIKGAYKQEKEDRITKLFQNSKNPKRVKTIWTANDFLRTIPRHF